MGLHGLVARGWRERWKRWEGKDKDGDGNVLTITFESRVSNVVMLSRWFGRDLVGKIDQSIVIFLIALSSPPRLTEQPTLNTTTSSTLLS